MLLPCTDNSLRALAQDRTPFRIGRFDSLPLEMERALTNLIYNEIRLFRKL